MAMTKEDKGLPERIIMSDGAKFHLSEKVNRHNVWIWGSKNPCTVIQIERGSPKVNVFCTVSERCVIRPIFFSDNTINRKEYLDMLENSLMPQLIDEDEQGPSTLAYGHLGGVVQLTPARSMNWSCNGHRQLLLHMATPFAGSHSV